jgi:hypothetical protein
MLQQWQHAQLLYTLGYRLGADTAPHNSPSQTCQHFGLIWLLLWQVLTRLVPVVLTSLKSPHEVRQRLHSSAAGWHVIHSSSRVLHMHLH